MTNKVNGTIEKYSMLIASDRVLIGLSGGADSVALLICLSELGYDVCACHVNHQLRGEESDRDQKFCEDLCKSKKIKLNVISVDVNTYCRDNKVGTEEGARALRYYALRKTAKVYGCDKIATAHNLNDCLETTLINLTRGTSLKGLCSIPPVREDIIRPLIECTRQEIEEFLSKRKQSFVTDSTNLCVDYTRNKMRHIVIPELLKVNPNLYKSYSRTLGVLNSEEEYLSRITSETLEHAKVNNKAYDRKILSECDKVILNRCIAQMLKNNNLECNTSKVIDICDIIINEGKINLSGNVYAISKGATISICEINEKPKNFETVITENGKYLFLDRTFEICVNKLNDNVNINKKFANCIIDYDKIIGTVVMRNRRDGDRIKLVSRPFTTSIKKLFNRDIPLENRDSVMFLSDDNGVIYLEGYGVADRVKVDEYTQNVLIVKASEGNSKNG